jgi:tRNA A-37 threonylcarbamoyl transferase component Bud32
MRRLSLPPRYVPIRLLGQGATAEVVLARDTELQREVAVKLLARELPPDPSIPERFTREALLAARLGRHPHVVTIHDVGRWRGRPFIVMEFQPGGSVEGALRARHVPQRQALAWLRQAAEAVDAAHNEGIVHRDLKPANLLLDEWERVQVADFGIARALDEARERLTLTGTILGTVGYLAPEQARGETASPGSDRYALAVVAYELLSGHRPFQSDSPYAEAAAHVHDPVPPAAGIPEAVFRRALAKRAEARFASAVAFVDELQAALGEREQATAIVPARPAPVASGPTAFLRRRRATGRAKRWGRRLGATVTAGVVAAFALLALGYVRADAPAAVTCTVSPKDHDANLVVSGVDADTYCADRAQQLSWSIRPGLRLRSPDLRKRPTVVCRARREGLRITVYDDGHQQIGRDLCDRYATNELAVAGS